MSKRIVELWIIAIIKSININNFSNKWNNIYNNYNRRYSLGIGRGIGRGEW